MALLKRGKYFLIGLSIYWPGIFIATHVPRLPGWLGRAEVSDKVLHYVAYLCLIFLCWVALSPYEKVNWRKAKVWIVLAMVVWYGAVDEWLQMYVNRSPSVYDFYANLAGTLSGLVILSLFSFWPALVIVSGMIIFISTNLISIAMVGPNAFLRIVFDFIAYGGFTLIWIHFTQHYICLKRFGLRWLTFALSVPVLLLVVVNGYSIGMGRQVGVIDVLCSFTAIDAAVVVSFLVCESSYAVEEIA